MQQPVLTLENVSKLYGEFTAVGGIDLQIPQGSVYGFLGPNGAGKTTTIRLILEYCEAQFRANFGPGR